MRIHIITLFPEMLLGPIDHSILGRAQQRGLVDIQIHNIRDYARDRHRTTDDYPYGGGHGMVMKPEPMFRAVETLNLQPDVPIVLTSPQGRLFTQSDAARLAIKPEMVLICGHYDGVDERVRERLVTEEVSIGDYVLTGGEIPSLVIVDAVIRLLPDVLGHSPEAVSDDSHTSGLLQYPHYTRPYDFRSWTAPDVLLSGNHAEITRWRREQSLKRTLERRPDLLAEAPLTEGDLRFLDNLRQKPTA